MKSKNEKEEEKEMDEVEEEDEVEVEPGRGVERPENFTHQTQPNRETKKEA